MLCVTQVPFLGAEAITGKGWCDGGCDGGRGGSPSGRHRDGGACSHSELDFGVAPRAHPSFRVPSTS